MKKKTDSAAPSQQGAADLDLDDTELVEAVKELAGMSPGEREEMMTELLGMLGDDPETLAALKEVMNEHSSMKVSDIKSAVKDMITEDEVAAATEDALKMLGRSKWEVIWEKQEQTLDAIIHAGQINSEDAALYKSNKKAWEKELRFIWNELQSQAAAARGSNEP